MFLHMTLITLSSALGTHLLSPAQEITYTYHQAKLKK